MGREEIFFRIYHEWKVHVSRFFFLFIWSNSIYDSRKGSKNEERKKKNEQSYHHIIVKCNDARGHIGPIASHHRHVLAITMYGYFLAFFFLNSFNVA